MTYQWVENRLKVTNLASGTASGSPPEFSIMGPRVQGLRRDFQEATGLSGVGSKADQGSNLAPHFQLVTGCFATPREISVASCKAGVVGRLLQESRGLIAGPECLLVRRWGRSSCPWPRHHPEESTPTAWALGSPQLPGAGAASPPPWSCFGHHPRESGRWGEPRLSTVLTQRRKGLLLFLLQDFFLMWTIF